MTLPTFTDLGLAAVVLVLAVVPAALAFLGLAGLLQATRLDTRLGALLGPAGRRAGAVIGGTALLALFLRLSWDWSAATHLKPLCAALGAPWFSAVADGGGAAAGAPTLAVRRRVLEAGYWTTITGDRYRAVDAAGNLLAEADELWIDAGPTRYRCGILSGPRPVRRREAAGTDVALARFLDRAGRGGGS